ncbi:MAG TPA: glycosyltransferase family 2 protein [Gammaproteobacteria bacterium]|nr:glycosyltransferase family 2 protein [Gammaproteobacteria bacterium]
MDKPLKISVVIPCYRVKAQVLDVLGRIGSEVTRVVCVDDACPEQSGAFVEQHCKDRRVKVVYLPQNLGVGGAVMAGYRAALEEDPAIVIKLDGDGQMDPRLIPVLTQPVISGLADYAKGNRFYSLENLKSMPAVRLFGNAVLSFMAKFSTGYWNIADPVNGYTAISGKVLRLLPLDKISRGWFFETDMLFRLNTLGAVIIDVPMDARYASENSNLRISRIFIEFMWKHARNYVKRVFYNYFLRGFSFASVELVLGFILMSYGVGFSLVKWSEAEARNQYASAGTVMIGALSIIIGFQLLLSFLNEDMRNQPRVPLQSRLP